MRCGNNFAAINLDFTESHTLIETGRIMLLAGAAVFDHNSEKPRYDAVERDLVRRGVSIGSRGTVQLLIDNDAIPPLRGRDGISDA